MWGCHVLHDAQDTNRMWSASGKSKYIQATEVKREESPCAATDLIFKWQGNSIMKGESLHLIYLAKVKEGLASLNTYMGLISTTFF